MKTFTTHQQVEAGLYFNRNTFAVTTMDAAGPLVGADNDTFYRVPMLLMLVLAPLLGLAFVMFLPLLGFAVVAQLLGTKAVQAVAGVMGESDRIRRPGWVPTLAFLSRAKHTKAVTPADAPKDEWAEDVENKLGKDDHTA